MQVCIEVRHYYYLGGVFAPVARPLIHTIALLIHITSTYAITSTSTIAIIVVMVAIAMITDIHGRT